MIVLVFCSLCYLANASGLRPIETPQYPIVRLHGEGLLTVVDRRGDCAGHSRIATLTMNHTIGIQFDLKWQLGDDKAQSLKKIRIMSFENQSVQLTIYVTELGQFGIMHYNRNLHQSQIWKRLVLISLSLVPKAENADGYQRFAIKIINKHMIEIEINGFVVRRNLEREICPAGEVMNVWLDRDGFKMNGAIRDPIIRVS